MKICLVFVISLLAVGVYSVLTSWYIEQNKKKFSFFREI